MDPRTSKIRGWDTRIILEAQQVDCTLCENSPWPGAGVAQFSGPPQKLWAYSEAVPKLGPM
jgi:hypothetical protein